MFKALPFAVFFYSFHLLFVTRDLARTLQVDITDSVCAVHCTWLVFDWCLKGCAHTDWHHNCIAHLPLAEN